MLDIGLPLMLSSHLAVVLAGIGAAMGGNLPFGIQQAVSETASEVGIDMPAPSTTDASAFRSDSPVPPVVVDRTRDVHDAIDGFKRDLTAWRTCIVETAPQRGANPAAACGQKPRLDVPRPYDDPLTLLDRGGAGLAVAKVEDKGTNQCGSLSVARRMRGHGGSKRDATRYPRRSGRVKGGPG